MSPKKPPRSRQTTPATQGAEPPPKEEERSLVEAPGAGYPVKPPPVIPAEVRHLFQNPDETVERLGQWESNNLRLLEGETDSDKYAEQLGLRVPVEKLKAVLTPEAFEHVKTLVGTPRNIARFRAVEPGECWAARLFQKWRKGYLIEDLVPESNEFPVVEIDDLRQAWMQNYITAPASDDRIVRCSNLVAAGLLPQNFTLLDLLVFVNRGKIPFLPSDDRDWIGWKLTPAGWEKLEALLTQEEETLSRNDPAPAPTVTPASQPKKKTGRKKIVLGWEAAAFQAELNIRNLPSIQDEHWSINKTILEALTKGMVKKDEGKTEVQVIAQVRARHKKRAQGEAQEKATAYVNRHKLAFEDNMEQALRKASETAKATCWRAYLEGGHEGNWLYLEQALGRELARLRKKLPSEK